MAFHQNGPEVSVRVYTLGCGEKPTNQYRKGGPGPLSNAVAREDINPIRAGGHIAPLPQVNFLKYLKNALR